MKLLLIEDSEPLRRGLKVGLNHLGFTVDGSEGLSMALTNRYDFISFAVKLRPLGRRYKAWVAKQS